MHFRIQRNLDYNKLLQEIELCFDPENDDDDLVYSLRIYGEWREDVFQNSKNLLTQLKERYPHEFIASSTINGYLWLLKRVERMLSNPDYKHIDYGISDKTAKTKELADLLEFLNSENVEKSAFERILTNDEVATLLNNLKKHYDYQQSYWIPLALKERNYKGEVLFVPAEVALKYRYEIERLIKKYDNTFFVTGERYFEDWGTEVEELTLSYDGLESVFCGKKFEWFIYVSHVDTITFAGNEFVSKIKELMKQDRDHFNSLVKR